MERLRQGATQIKMRQVRIVLPLALFTAVLGWVAGVVLSSPSDDFALLSSWNRVAWAIERGNPSEVLSECTRHLELTEKGAVSVLSIEQRFLCRALVSGSPARIAEDCEKLDFKVCDSEFVDNLRKGWHR